MMIRNPITEEIRAIRHRLAAQFDNDIDRIGQDVRAREAASGRQTVRLKKRSPRTTPLTSKPLSLSEATDVLPTENQTSPAG
jgi:hypothetical protein